MADDHAQARLLSDATRKVSEQAFYMKRAVDHNDFKGAINYSFEMLKELRTHSLSPKSYYELYMKVLDEIRFIEDYFVTLNRQGTPMVDMYERVQSCSAVLPRLYMLVTVGGCYIKSGEAPARDLLKDLLEMTKGVQHPMRGLFLRNYLSHVTRDKLPDAGSPYEGEGGTVEDSVDFVLENFTEANRLWVRMHHQGPAKDKKKKERERKELRLLVGTNLVRLSQLEGVDVRGYRETILPRILEQVSACRDTIAQSYLMDCLIQVFPDDFHLYTLDAFLDGVCKLKEKVKVRPILESLMERLSNYVEANPDALPPELKAFQVFNQAIAKLIQDRANLDLSEIILLQVSLLNFASKCYPQRLDYVNHCLGISAQAMASKNIGPGGQGLPEACVEPVERLLSLPLRSMVLRVLELSQYSELMRFLPWENQKQVCFVLLRSVLDSNHKLSDVEELDKLLNVITPLLRDPPDQAPRGNGAPQSEGVVEEEQHLVARLVHLMHSPDTDVHFRLLVVARRYFGQGGITRIQSTLVPLVFVALQLAQRVRRLELDIVQAQQKLQQHQQQAMEPPSPPPPPSKDTEEAAPPSPGGQSEPAGGAAEAGEGAVLSEEDLAALEALAHRELQYSSRKVFQFEHEIVTAMSSPFPWTSLRLFLECALGADRASFSNIAYEFLSQAFILYEDELTDSKAQVRALVLMVGTLMACSNFQDGDFDSLTTKTAQYAAKMLKKPDQCRMVTLCSHLFWVNRQNGAPYHDGRRVLECLQRALKIADVCMASSLNVQLFIEILNHYVYYFEENCLDITDKYLSGLVALIHEHIDSMDASDLRAEVETYFHNTLQHIRSKKGQMDLDDALRERFSAIMI